MINKRLTIAFAIILLLSAGFLVWYSLRPEEEKNGGILSRFFPEGGGERLPGEEGEEKRDEQAPLLLVSKGESANARKLVSEPVAGATLAKGKVRYVERATGYVFEIDSDGGQKERISNTLIPGIFEVVWSPTGERAVLKYPTPPEGELRIFSAFFQGSSTKGIFLPHDIVDVTFSPRGDRIGYVVTSGDETQVVSATPENKSQRVVFHSPFSSWGISWPEDGKMYLATRPSAFTNGFFYRLNLSSGALEKISGPAPGLDAKTNGAFAILSQFDPTENGILSTIGNMKTGEVKKLSDTILPEKCVWSKKAKNILFCPTSALPPQRSSSYPDDWYKGKVSFRDDILKIDAETFTMTMYELPRENILDVLHPFLAEDESALFFINKYDGSLWRVNLK